MEYWPFVDTCTCHSYSKLYYLCHLASLLGFYHHPPYLHTPPTIPSPLPSHHSIPTPLPPTSPLLPFHPHPYISWSNINEFHEKIVKSWQKSAIIYILASTKLTDNYVSIIMLSEQVQYKGKVDFLIKVSKWYFSKYWQVQTRQVFTQTVTLCYAMIFNGNLISVILLQFEWHSITLTVF